MDKIKLSTTMAPGTWTDARIAAAETGIPAGDVLAQCLELILLHASHARNAGDKRPAPDFALGLILAMQALDMITPAEAETRINRWAERCPVSRDKPTGYRDNLNRLAVSGS